MWYGGDRSARTIRDIVPEFTSHVPPPCDDPVGIVHADDDVLVVHKPSGLLSVPGRFVKDCVLHRLLYDFPDARIVHRLDLDTSGLMVLARSSRAVSTLSRAFRERQVDKVYVASVWGVPSPSSGEIAAPLAPDPVRRPRHRVDPSGKPALTRYEVIGETATGTRLSLSPVTGRSHQLRVHLAHIGHPILGCDLYAHPDAFHSADRLLLHATQLAFVHPVSGERVVFSSPSPF
ncbi:MAG: RluA family pseudouridine synthase [Pseudomonadales bacterium]|nr:RluA family pseudouridine synthase [Pseudomonadales bacterium]